MMLLHMTGFVSIYLRTTVVYSVKCEEICLEFTLHRIDRIDHRIQNTDYIWIAEQIQTQVNQVIIIIIQLCTCVYIME